MEQGVRAQRRVQVVHEVDVGGVVEAAVLRQQPRLLHQLLGVLVPFLGEDHLVRFLVDPVIARALLLLLADQLRRDRVDAHVEVGRVFGLARDDERRARLVDQDRIDLVDDARSRGARCTFSEVWKTMLSRR